MKPHPILELRDVFGYAILDGPDSTRSVTITTSHPNTANTALVSAGSVVVAVAGRVEPTELKIGDGNDELGYMTGNSLIYSGQTFPPHLELTVSYS